MTQKQIDTLKELGFKECGEDDIKHHSRVFNTVDIGLIVITLDEDAIAVSNAKGQLMKAHKFTLTKLREIVGKLEKL